MRPDEFPTYSAREALSRRMMDGVQAASLSEPLWLTRLRANLAEAGDCMGVELGIEQVRYLLTRWPVPPQAPLYTGEHDVWR